MNEENKKYTGAEIITMLENNTGNLPHEIHAHLNVFMNGVLQCIYNIENDSYSSDPINYKLLSSPWDEGFNAVANIYLKLKRLSSEGKVHAEGYGCWIDCDAEDYLKL